MKPIRVSAKAIIIRDDSILAIRMQGDEGGVHYILPGGGQNKFENLKEAVRRECREEISADVSVERLVFVREYIGRDHEFAAKHADLHQVELYFACDLIGTPQLRPGHEPDTGQVGVDWLALEGIEELPLYPVALRSALRTIDSGDSPIYLGAVN